MSFIQKILLSVLPKARAEEIRRESEAWRICCTTCGTSRSVWDAGGLRWKAASVGKRIMVRCSQCGTLRAATMEYVPKTDTQG